MVIEQQSLENDKRLKEADASIVAAEKKHAAASSDNEQRLKEALTSRLEGRWQHLVASSVCQQQLAEAEASLAEAAEQRAVASLENDKRLNDAKERLAAAEQQHAAASLESDEKLKDAEKRLAVAEQQHAIASSESEQRWKEVEERLVAAEQQHAVASSESEQRLEVAGKHLAEAEQQHAAAALESEHRLKEAEERLAAAEQQHADASLANEQRLKEAEHHIVAAEQRHAAASSESEKRLKEVEELLAASEQRHAAASLDSEQRSKEAAESLMAAKEQHLAAVSECMQRLKEAEERQIAAEQRHAVAASEIEQQLAKALTSLAAAEQQKAGAAAEHARLQEQNEERFGAVERELAATVAELTRQGQEAAAKQASLEQERDAALLLQRKRQDDAEDWVACVEKQRNAEILHQDRMQKETAMRIASLERQLERAIELQQEQMKALAAREFSPERSSLDEMALLSKLLNGIQKTGESSPAAPSTEESYMPVENCARGLSKQQGGEAVDELDGLLAELSDCGPMVQIPLKCKAPCHDPHPQWSVEDGKALEPLSFADGVLGLQRLIGRMAAVLTDLHNEEVCEARSRTGVLRDDEATLPSLSKCETPFRRSPTAGTGESCGDGFHKKEAVSQFPMVGESGMTPISPEAEVGPVALPRHDEAVSQLPMVGESGMTPISPKVEGSKLEGDVLRRAADLDDLTEAPEIPRGSPLGSLPGSSEAFGSVATKLNYRTWPFANPYLDKADVTPLAKQLSTSGTLGAGKKRKSLQRVSAEIAPIVVGQVESTPPRNDDRPLQVCWAWQDDGHPVEQRLSIRRAFRDSNDNGPLIDLAPAAEVRAYPRASPAHLALDAIGVALVLYEMIMVPLAVFELPSNGMSDFIVFAMPFFWAFDMYRVFRRGYVESGVEERRLSKVAWNYMTSWFGVDSIALCFDFLVVLTSTGAVEFSNLGFNQKIDWPLALRCVRVIRLPRVRARLTGVVSTMLSRTAARERCEMAIGILEPTAVVAFCGHALACGFFGVSDAFSHQMGAWVPAHLGGRVEGQNGYAGSAYLAAAQWAASLFTPAATDVHPGSDAERAYALCTSALAAVLLAWLLTAIIGVANQLSTAKRRRRELLDAAHEDLERCGAEPSLQGRIMMWLQAQEKIGEVWAQPRRKNQSSRGTAQLPMLAELPDELRAELDDLERAPVLAGHTLFARLQEDHLQLPQLLRRSLVECAFSPAEEVFGVGDSGTRAYIVARGELRYLLAAPWQRHRETARKPLVSLPAGRWLAEPSLWIDSWTHRGRAFAALSGWAATDVFSLSTNILQEVLLQRDLYDARVAAVAYARELVRRASEQQQPLTDVVDLQTQQEIIDAALLASMGTPRTPVGCPKLSPRNALMPIKEIEWDTDTTVALKDCQQTPLPGQAGETHENVVPVSAGTSCAPSPREAGEAAPATTFTSMPVRFTTQRSIAFSVS
eukprot:TRINITY_DN13781_c0_g1_i2.p1 TRINITY_DN13781_c0_g1~~TRINITY_DN13781_c0_g1_i2.p1  ORF type:complete len:1655 (+),score=408.51 TRINITY_DN13781_c0_g1_i2:614-4966(+)